VVRTSAQFSSRLRAWANKTDRTLEEVDYEFKYWMFDRIVRLTRWDTGKMRGGWNVSNSRPEYVDTGFLNKGGGLPTNQAAKIQFRRRTYLTNSVSYTPIWNDRDAIIATARADASRMLNRALGRVR
tara:strand:- start:14468 stop:14848 length:381 start_codon:yes stop_codon:yes gene_type:complete